MVELTEENFIEFIGKNMYSIKNTIIGVKYYNSKYDFTNLFKDLNMKEYSFNFQLEFIEYYENLKLFIINHLESIPTEDKNYILSFYKK